MDLGLSGVAAAVAGASRGLGHAIALELAREGAQVAICARDEDAIKGAATSIQGSTGAEVRAIAADVATAEGAARFIEEAAEKMEGLQILVTNAGGPPPGSAVDMADEQWLAAVDLNFLSTVRMTRAALPHLRKQEWGRIVCVTSASVKQPAPNLALSNAVRAAATGFAKTLAREVAGSGITVNCVMPWHLVTDRLKQLAGASPEATHEDPAFASMVAENPTGRLGHPEELAAVVAFLCSERASFVNGVSLPVDGGFLGSAH